MASERAAVLVARLERLPVTRPVLWARGCVGMATFFDGYTTIALAYAMPILAKQWSLTPSATAAIISSGYLGQLIGAVFFGWLAERIGRLPVLAIAIGIFAAMSAACIFAWGPESLILFRFLQGIGTGGEVPVASAYVNELSGAKKRGRFFLLYELLFLVGLTAAGAIGYASHSATGVDHVPQSAAPCPSGAGLYRMGQRYHEGGSQRVAPACVNSSFRDVKLAGNNKE
jgi:putative MFS transporter